MMDQEPEFKPYPPEIVNKHRGKVGIVLGNGPSINEYNLKTDFFKNAITFGTNAIGIKIHPTYYLITDKRAWNWYQPMVAQSAAKGSKLIIGAKQLRRIKALKLPPPPKNLFVIRYKSDDALGEPVLGGPLFHGRTVGIVALNLAFQMGCNPVYMLGIDGFSLPKKHFHKLHEKEINKVHSKDERDELVKENLIKINRAFWKDNRRLINLSSCSIWKGIIPKGKLGD